MVTAMQDARVTGSQDPSARPVAWHVGRQGEVAGGMTQVVNGYLAWPFETMDVRVITSRDGSEGPRAWLLLLRAVLSVLRLKNTSQNMLVVHLSQGGSFVREGLLLLLGRMRGFGTAAHIHGSSFVEFASRHPWVVGRVLRAANKVIVLSAAAQKAVERFVAPGSVELVPNAVPEGQAVEKERLVVFGGGVTHRKGVDVLVEAWRRVGAGRGWQLAIAGPIIDKHLVPDSLADAEFLGAVPHRRLMELLDRASIAVLPSRDEAMPMFILEAMARDNCVISTKVGGIPAVLGEGRGILVDAANADQLAQALDTAMSDDSVRKHVAATGRRAFNQSYSARAIYPRVERLWAGVIRDAAASGTSEARQ